ncbi:efflux RND transporter periplasmic adaptor subunit [Gammaproteobacteria bacterium]|jgi:membrane fusion protein, macrolide-specific efflux system|nr:efflux RND transporter periplasmic adaptor subunit [Gammaproteobacteria bacterium]
MNTSEVESETPVNTRRGVRKFWIVAVGLVLCGAGGWYYWQSDSQQEATNQPLIVTVQIGNIENTITAAGSLQPFDFVDVGAQVNGILETLHVDIGDVVEEGQLMAEIDARIQLARVEASRASIEALEAQIAARNASLALARANARRQERLRDADATSELDYDNAVNNLASAEAGLIQLEKQIIQSKASLESDETQLEFSRIYAPSAGTVVSLDMNEGRTINANQQAPTILRIADLTTMTVETEISEADISSIRKGMPVYFTTLGGGSRRWYSTVRQILPTPIVENNVVLYTGLFDIDNSDGSLLSDMTAQVYFVTSSAENVPTVPVGALTFIDQPGAGGFPGAGAAGRPAAFGGAGNAAGRPGPGAGRGNPQAAPARRLATVRVVTSNGNLEEREIMVGVTSRIAAEVISGLEVGDEVVAGILQNIPGSSAPGGEPDRREMFRAMGGFR